MEIIFSMILAVAISLAIGAGMFAVAWIVSTPIITLLQHWFPKLRPQAQPPIFINMHRPFFAHLSGDKTVRPPTTFPPLLSVLPPTLACVEYQAEQTQVERFERPFRPAPAAVIPIRRRALLRYLRRAHPEILRTDQELIDDFMQSF